MSDSLRPHGLQHARLPCPSPSLRNCSNSCPWSWWCHPTISSFVVPFSFCLQSFPASGSFSVSHFFPSGGQSIEASGSASVLPMNIQDWFPLGFTGLFSSLSKRLSRVFSNTTVQKHQLFAALMSNFIWMFEANYFALFTSLFSLLLAHCIVLIQVFFPSFSKCSLILFPEPSLSLYTTLHNLLIVTSEKFTIW